MKLSFLLAQFPGMPELPTDSIPDPKQELASLKSLSFDELINRLVSDVVEFAVHLAIAILVFYVGRFIINKLYSFVSAVLSRREVEESLSSFILSLVRIVLYFILIVTVIGILGINTSSFLAIFASVGVAIGMALSGTLQNFAGGVLILLLKPYRIGDFIEAQGFTGTVTDIQIFSTWICTSDNKTIIIPNGGLSTGTITNWSKQNYRRIQWDVGISYGDDFRSAARAIHRIMASVKEIVFLDADGNIIALCRSACFRARGKAEEEDDVQPHGALVCRPQSPCGRAPQSSGGHHQRRASAAAAEPVGQHLRPRRFERQPRGACVGGKLSLLAGILLCAPADLCPSAQGRLQFPLPADGCPHRAADSARRRSLKGIGKIRPALAFLHLTFIVVPAPNKKGAAACFRAKKSLLLRMR